MTSNKGPTVQQHRRMHVLWRIAGVSDRGDRLALTCKAIGRTIHSSSQMTFREAAALIRYMEGLDEVEQLHGRAQEWLAGYHRRRSA